MILHKGHWLVLSGVGIIFFMINMDLTLVNVALPTIAHFFHAAMPDIQWIMTSYVVIGAMFMIAAGYLADIFGRKRVYLCGVAIFTLASCGAGLSSKVLFLIIARAFQGLGIALLFPLNNVFAFNVFPPHKRGLIMGIMAAITGLAQAIGPVISGIILQMLNWPWIFFLNVPLGLLVIVFVGLGYEEEIVESKKTSIDYIGIVLLSFGLFATVLALNEMQKLSTFWFYIYLFTGLLSLTLFAILENKLKYPLLDFRLLKNRTFFIATIIRALFQYVYFALLFVLAILLQNTLGYSACANGILLLSMTVVCGILAPFAGKWIDKAGIKAPTKIALFLATTGFLCLMLIGKTSHLVFFIMPLFMLGCAAGILFTSCITAALFAATKEKTGSATGLFFTVALIGSSIGVAVSGNITSFSTVMLICAILSGVGFWLTRFI